MAKKETYKDKDQKELEKMIAEKRKALQNFRFEAAGGKVANVKFAKNTRREIARMLTVLQNLKQESKV